MLTELSAVAQAAACLAVVHLTAMLTKVGAPVDGAAVTADAASSGCRAAKRGATMAGDLTAVLAHAARADPIATTLAAKIGVWSAVRTDSSHRHMH